MTKSSIKIRRLSSFSLFKIMLFSTVSLLFLINLAIVLFHLITLDFTVEYTSGEESEVAKEASLLLYSLFSFPVLIVAAAIQTVFFWPFATIGLWAWSKFKPLELEFYEYQDKNV